MTVAFHQFFQLVLCWHFLLNTECLSELVDSVTRLFDLLDFGQQLICTNVPHSKAMFVKVSKSLIFLVKSILGNFHRHLVTFTGRTVGRQLLSTLIVNFMPLLWPTYFVTSVLNFEKIPKEINICQNKDIQKFALMLYPATKMQNIVLLFPAFLLLVVSIQSKCIDFLQNSLITLTLKIFGFCFVINSRLLFLLIYVISTVNNKYKFWVNFC